MGKALKLVNKLNRRAKSLKSHGGGFDRYDKVSRSEEIMAKSQKAYKLERKNQRRLDRSFGIDMLRYEPKISKRVKATTLDRFDYGGSNFGIRATFAAGLIADIGLRPGDIVRVLHGGLKGHYLKVVTITDSTHARLEDDASFNYAGTKEKSTVTTTPDIAGSLNSKYFTFRSATNAAFYAWLNVNGAGVDPAPGGTGVMVAVATNASAATIATAAAAAIDALAQFVSTATGAVITITNAAVGAATDTTAGNSGFTVATLTQGTAANPTVSESNRHCRFQLSDVKSSYR